MLDDTHKNLDETSRKSSEAKMSSVAQAKSLMQDIAGPAPYVAPVKAMVNAVASATGIGVRRLHSIWHDEIKSISSEEMDALRNAAAVRSAKREAKDRDDYQDIKTRLAFLEARLAQIDPHFSRATMDADRGTSPGMGGVRGSLAGGR